MFSLMQALNATFLAVDISRKGGKGVHVLNTKFCNSTLSVMNEYGQIILSVMCPVESMKEGACRIALDALSANLKRRGMCEIIMSHPYIDTNTHATPVH